MPRILSPKARILRPGLYEHYMGKRYHVIGVAFHSETFEELVIYRETEGTRLFWLKPLEGFTETVEIYGERVPRFNYLNA